MEKKKKKDSPILSIGLPVFNGENYLAETLDSILAQTFTDFELIISDNASTDRTRDICRDYVARDSRIRYFCNSENIGASENFNRAFELSSGKYFKWAAHDDLLAPRFLEQCVEALEQDESVILSFSRSKEIDEEGNILKDFMVKSGLGSQSAPARFYECTVLHNHQIPIFGVIRSAVLKQTPLFKKISSSDRVLLGELALLGRFHEIPEPLFFYRHHSVQSWMAYKSRQEYIAWFDPSKAGKITFPHWRLMTEHFRSIANAPLRWHERGVCYLYMVWWVRFRWRYLLRNLMLKDVRNCV